MSETQTEAIEEPIKQEPEIQESKPKEVIIAIGKLEGEHACEYCAEADQKLPEKKAVKSGKVPYEFVDIDSDRGEQELNEVRLSKYDGVRMPVIKRCNVPDNPDEKRHCEVSQGYEDKDYYDLDNFDP